jgi:zinc transporter 1/2/3
MTQSNNTFALRIVAIFVAIIASSLGFYLPYLRPKELICDDISLSWMCLKAFAAGTILCVGVVHLLGDAIETLSDLDISDYPIALTLAVAGISITLGIEMCALTLMKGVNNKDTTELIQDKKSDIALTSIKNENLNEESETHDHDVEKPLVNENINKSIIKSIILEACVGLHSVIIGISLGGMDKKADSSNLKVLIVAYAFHQFFEGIVLGTGTLESKFNRKVTFWFWFVFVITVPIGIIIGITTNSSDSSEIFSACASSIASGSLIYTSLVEMIAEDFMHARVFHQPKLIPSMYFSFLLGYGVMALLANWA